MEKLKINYHVTEACNFRCKFCFAKYTNKTLGFEEQKAVIKKIAQSNLFEKINFIGGGTAAGQKYCCLNQIFL